MTDPHRVASSSRPARSASAVGVPARPPLWWTVLSVFAAVLLVGVGALVMAAGEADDSPGLGGLGLLNALVGLVIGVRAVSAARRRGPRV